MTIAEAFVARSRALLTDEYRIKIRRAVEAMPDGTLWWRPNEASNSVGNLLLHLEGNVRQWIVAGIGGATDTRDRSAEFAARESATAADLLARLDAVLDEADAVLASLDERALLEPRAIQGRDVIVLDAVYQVVQHFALHSGQIFFIAKERAPGSVRFYDDSTGIARPIWREAR